MVSRYNPLVYSVIGKYANDTTGNISMVITTYGWKFKVSNPFFVLVVVYVKGKYPIVILLSAIVPNTIFA